MSKVKVSTIVLGIFNIILGLIFALLIIIMQGFFLFLLGFVYIFLGITILSRKLCNKFLFSIAIALTVWFSLFIIMLGIDKDIPEYAKIPLGVGMIVLSPFWIIIIADIFFFNHQKKSILIKQDKTKN